MTDRQASCDERIAEHQTSRVAHFAALRELSEYSDGDELSEPARELLSERGIDWPAGDARNEETRDDDVNEAGREAAHELPLGVSASTVFRVDLSTGGPGDWLEVHASGDTPNYEPAGDGEHYEVDRIVYHFNDWFDHAERQLDGDDYEAALWFVSQVVAELID